MDNTCCNNDVEPYDYENHWNKAYEKTPVKFLGWFEEEAQPTLELVQACELPKDAFILNVGAGASVIVEQLLTNGYNNIAVNDISPSALLELKNCLSEDYQSNVQYIIDDLTNSTEIVKLNNVDLWNDRAVLHFFTTEAQQKAYFELIKKVVNPGGFVILAEFNLEGAKKCCGLDIFNYNEQMLQERLGDEFKLLKSFDHTYTQPSGNSREYVYTLFQRKA